MADTDDASDELAHRVRNVEAAGVRVLDAVIGCHKQVTDLTTTIDVFAGTDSTAELTTSFTIGS